MIELNLSMKQKLLTDIKNRFVVAKAQRRGEGWIGSLGLADVDYFIWNG